MVEERIQGWRFVASFFFFGVFILLLCFEYDGLTSCVQCVVLCDVRYKRTVELSHTHTVGDVHRGKGN